ncbi:MAG: amidohydrolase [Candidatus Dadabacteria bacterium]|nr:MAG: amidohydrolase [Candidatus Dadabacteria bacterium]
MAKRKHSRRTFLAALGGATATSGLAWAAWGDRDVLEQKLPRPHGDVPGYRGLAQLPYFDLTANGLLKLKPDLAATLPRGVDFHSHLGLSIMFAPDIDYHREVTRPQYLVDCDLDPDCRMAMDDYLNKIATPKLMSDMHSKLAQYGLIGGGPAARTHTIPALVQEMDLLNLDLAVLLVVAPKLPFRINNTWKWYDALQESPHRDRFVLFGTVDHPLNSSAPAQVREMAKRGIRGIKLHPTMQQFFPDDPAVMPVYAEAARHGMAVFYHCGRAGIEPRSSQPFAHPKRYRKPPERFPEIPFIFGHAGARDWREAMAVAADYDNVWLEIEGQGVLELQTMIKELSPEKLVFGSDWPFFPEAAMMARLLMATEGQPDARRLILSDNARGILRRIRAIA